MDLVLGSFRANFEGKPAVQPCVSLELRAAGQKELTRILADNAWVPVKLEEGPRQITGVTEDATIYDAAPETLAPGMMAEFSDPEFDDSEPATEEPNPAAAATQAKTEALSDKLKNARKPEAAAAPETAKAPWTDRPTMTSAFNVQKARVGDARFEEIRQKHDVLMGSLKPEDPRAAAIYADLVASPAKAAEPQSDDVF